MIFCDFKKEFRRAYIRYLLEEVIVEPLDDFSIITFTLGAIHFVKGEEIGIPRWLAKILEERGKVRIIGDELKDPKKLIARLISYLKEVGTESMNKDIYIKIYEILKSSVEEEIKKRILKTAKAFIEFREPKIITQAFEKEEHDIIWEDVLFKLIKQCLEEWSNTIFSVS